MGTPLPSRAALRRIAVPIGRSPRGPGRPMLASAHDEPRSGSNKSERESTSVRSINYGSGHLIQVFRDIGRIFSLPFLLSQPVAHWVTRREGGFKSANAIWFRRRQKMVSIVFRVELTGGGRARRRVIRQTRTPPDSQGRGSREPFSGYFLPPKHGF